MRQGFDKDRVQSNSVEIERTSDLDSINDLDGGG